jgi:hypothetical protein
MVCLLRRSSPLLLLALVAWAALPGPLLACPFCGTGGQTLTGEVGQARMVVFGKLAKGNIAADTTDFAIERVIKDDGIRGKKTTVTLSRYIPPEAGTKYLVFCDVFRGKIDPYRGVAVAPGSVMPKYLEGALKIKDKPIGQRLRFFFDYLDNTDLEISNDAYKEFANADYKDYRDMAKDLPAARIVKWLGDPATPSFRYGLYASMLGHCGKARDAAVLRGMLDDSEKRTGSGMDGIMAGYIMLVPKEGWKYTQNALKNTKNDFLFRYAALRAVRFLHEFRSDLISKKELVEGICVLLDQEDMADLAIEDLRKWKCWDKVDRVLAVCKTEAYKQPIVRRAILRYCLSCPGKPAAAHVAEQRKENAEAVSEAEELLKLDQEKPAPAPSSSKPDKK